METLVALLGTFAGIIVGFVLGVLLNRSNYR